MPRARARNLDDAGIHALGEHRVLVLDDMLGPCAAAAIRCEALARWEAGALRPAGIGRGASLDSGIRGDHIAWLAGDELAFVPVLELFGAVMLELATSAYLGARTIEAQLAVYPPGASYVRHHDRIAGTHDRRMTLIYYANPWQPGDGGELEVHETDGGRVIEPIDDRLVVFRPELEHEVREVARAPRVAISGWLRG